MGDKVMWRHAGKEWQVSVDSGVRGRARPFGEKIKSARSGVLFKAVDGKKRFLPLEYPPATLTGVFDDELARWFDLAKSDDS